MILVLVVHLLCIGVSEGVYIGDFRTRGLGIAVMPGPIENHRPALRSTLGHKRVMHVEKHAKNPK